VFVIFPSVNSLKRELIIDAGPQRIVPDDLNPSDYFVDSYYQKRIPILDYTAADLEYARLETRKTRQIAGLSEHGCYRWWIGQQLLISVVYTNIANYGWD
jgi:hypothetical protein